MRSRLFRAELVGFLVTFAFLASAVPAVSQEGLSKLDKSRRPNINSTIVPEFGPEGGGGGGGETAPLSPANVLLQAPEFDPTAQQDEPCSQSPHPTIAGVTVADGDIGILNTADRALEVSLSNRAGLIKLNGHHLKTFALSAGTKVTATLETQGVGGFTTVLQPGTFYVIEASAGRWVLRKL